MLVFKQLFTFFKARWSIKQSIFNMMSMVPCKYLIYMNSISTYSAFADDEEGVAVGPLPDDVVALFVERLEV
jgi:hypothetical protein